MSLLVFIRSLANINVIGTGYQLLPVTYQRINYKRIRMNKKTLDNDRLFLFWQTRNSYFYKEEEPGKLLTNC